VDLRTVRTRATRQRAAIVGLLDELDGFHSAQDLHQMLRERGETVGLTTVYRALQAMAEAGEVDSIQATGGETYFRRCSTGHHHHLVCRKCGAAVEVTGPAVERWAARVATEHGYTDVEHSLEVLGTCGDCATS
jgi:Fur family ferric uptake transcriptional regulator